MSTKKNFIYNFLLTGSNLLFPLLTFPYLSRILGAEGIGICNFIVSYGQNFIIVAALGLPVYGCREIAKIGDDKVKRSKLFFELLIIHLSFTLILLAIYITSVLLYPDFRNYKSIALIGASLILFNVFSFEWLYTGVNNFKYITIRSITIRALSVAAIFIFVKQKTDFTLYFIILTCTVFFTTLVDVISSRPFITRKIHLSLSGILKHTRPIFLLGIYMVLTSIYSVLPVTLLGFLSTKAAVGYYYGANRIIRMIISVFAALITVMIPRLNLMHEEKGEVEYLSMVNKSLSIVIPFGIAATFYVFLFARPIVMLLAGANFINSILVIQIMSPVILFVAFAQVFVLLILSIYRKDSYMVALSFIGMILSLVINLVFIPAFAEKATAFSQLVAEALVTLVSFILAKKVINFKFPFRVFYLNLIFVIPFAVISFISFRISENNFLILAVSGLLCALYFFVYQIFIIKDQTILNVTKPYLGLIMNPLKIK
jgi:O-antigen/teichoic acid export membrane protein